MYTYAYVYSVINYEGGKGKGEGGRGEEGAGEACFCLRTAQP